MIITKKLLQAQRKESRWMSCCLLVVAVLLIFLVREIVTRVSIWTSEKPYLRTGGSSFPASDFAYVWLLAGVDPQRESLFRGMLYTIAIAIRQLKIGSRFPVDFVVMIQCKTQENGCLSRDFEELLSPARIFYIPPKRHHNSFYKIQYLKFRTLLMEEYRKVVFMDSDILPLCSMDSLFGLTTKAAVVAWQQEPATGGLFVLTPSRKDYDTLQRFIAEKESEVAQQGKWDETRGWGHEFQGEGWRTISAWPGDDGYHPITDGTLWNWPGAFADQGLLYYYVRFVLDDTSIFNLDGTEIWIGGRKQRGLEASLVSCLSPMAWKDLKFDVFPYSHFIHFTSNSKPWLHPPQNDLPPDMDLVATSTDYWWYLVREVVPNINFNEAFEAATPLGNEDYPKLMDMIRAGQRRQKESK